MLTVRRESRVLDFKKTFDPSNTGDWCELVKDLVAMANTDGGYVIIGATDNGADSGCDLTAVASVDQAVIVDKIGKYTDMQPSVVDLRHFTHRQSERGIFHVGASDMPIVFCRPGTYAVGGDRQKTAFSAGTVYFRHGSKSVRCSPCAGQIWGRIKLAFLCVAGPQMRQKGTGSAGEARPLLPPCRVPLSSSFLSALQA